MPCLSIYLCVRLCAGAGVCVRERGGGREKREWGTERERERERERACFIWAVFAVGKVSGGVVYVSVRLYISCARLLVGTIQPTYRTDQRRHWSRKKLENLHVCWWRHTQTHTHKRAHGEKQREREAEREDFCLKQRSLSNYLFVQIYAQLSLNLT